MAQYRGGKVQILGFLVGQVMKRSGGRARRAEVQQLMRQALEREPAAALRPESSAAPAARARIVPLIQFFHVSKQYPGGQAALDDVTLRHPARAVRLPDRRERRRQDDAAADDLPRGGADRGQIVVNGRNVSSIPPSKIPYLRRTIGVVFQDFRLIARKTVFENVTYLPRVLGIDAQEPEEDGLPGAAPGGARPSPERLPAASCRAASSSGWRSPGR